MALQSRVVKDLPGPALAGWDETKRVPLPGGGTIFVPRAFLSTVNPKERTPKYVWRGEAGEGSIALELIAYHHAARIDRARFTPMVQDDLGGSGGALVGELESLTVGGCETLYGRYRLPAGEGTDPLFAAYARILTPNAGLLFEATHADLVTVDELAKAVLGTINFSLRPRS